MFQGADEAVDWMCHAWNMFSIIRYQIIKHWIWLEHFRGFESVRSNHLHSLLGNIHL